MNCVSIHFSFDSGVESGSVIDDDMDILNHDEMVRYVISLLFISKVQRIAF